MSGFLGKTGSGLWRQNEAPALTHEVDFIHILYIMKMQIYRISK